MKQYKIKSLLFAFFALAFNSIYAQTFPLLDWGFNSTDPVTWVDAVDPGSGSNTIQNGTCMYRMLVEPSYVVTYDNSIANAPARYMTGGIRRGGSTGSFVTPELDFISGGTITAYFINVNTGTSTRTSTLTQLPNTYTCNPSNPAGTTLTTFSIPKNAYVQKFTHTLPPTVTGKQRFAFSFSNGQDYYMIGLYIETGVGTMPVIATIPHKDVVQNFSAVSGGNKTTNTIQVKGYNLTGNVSMEIIGADARLFSIPDNSIALSEVLAGKDITITYTSSVMIATHQAQLKLSSPGASDVFINLVGNSTPTTSSPTITTPATTYLFATGIIGTATNEVNITGVNLTGNITLSITGANASQFSLSSATVSPALAMSTGLPVTITYQGFFQAPVTQTAKLILSSPGATPVEINLIGKTFTNNPIMYNLVTGVSPTGSGYVIKNPSGTSFPAGTVVKITALPETGYKFVRWDDIASTSLVRNITMNENKNINAIFEIGTGGGGEEPTGGLIAYSPLPATITTTGFTARWTSVTGAPNYTITVFDGTTPVVTQTVSSTNYNVTGLSPGTTYTYQVKANTTNGETSEIVGPFQTTKDPIGPVNCGD